MLVPKQGPRSLDLHRMGAVDDALLEWLAGELRPRLGSPVHAAAALPLDPCWRDEERGQFSSNAIVDALVAALPAAEADLRASWRLVLTEVDLFAPGRPFVFGEATLGGCCALLSLARLGEGAGVGSLYRARVLKEALHELGHVAGLDHCGDADCVMAESADVEDVDAKSSDFCSFCSAAMPCLSGSSGG